MPCAFYFPGRQTRRLSIRISFSYRFASQARMSFDPKQPYNDLPLLPPPGDLETKQILKNASRPIKRWPNLKAPAT
jgi:hypothetical protein